MRALTTKELQKRVTNWADINDVTLLNLPTKTSDTCFFKVNSGDYKGCTGSRLAGVMRVSIAGVDWKCITKESRAQFICDKFADAGFTVIALPVSLSVCAKITCVRGVDNKHWEVTLVNFMKGRRPRDKYKASKGEQTIEAILAFNGVEFEKEYPITLQGKMLRYDFFIPSERLYIEYHGEQHYREVSMLSGKIPLATRQLYDQWKQDYAELNGSLLVTPYTVTSVLDICNQLNERIKLTLPTKGYLTDYSVSRLRRDVDIADYYLTHSCEDTCKSFKVGNQTVTRAFKTVYGCNRMEYNRGSETLDEMLDYYLTHSQSEVQAKYRSSQYLDKAFKIKYGMGKREYLNQRSVLVYKQATEYFTNHTVEETTKKFGLSESKLYKEFKQVYGVPKTIYLKEREITNDKRNK